MNKVSNIMLNLRTTSMVVMHFFLCTHIYGVTTTSYIDKISPTQYTMKIDFVLDENEAILANSLRSSIDHPNLSISKPRINIPSIKKYIPEFKQKKQVYDHNFQLTVIITHKEAVQTICATAHISYLSTKNATVSNLKLPITCNPTITSDPALQEIQKNNTLGTPQENSIAPDASFTGRIQNLVEQSQTPFMQILFALLLGLLLSLTPCIYPMIPITIGILHSNSKKSLLQNFLGSLSYACGLATTFACLGLIATVAGSSFGSLLSNTPFIIILVLFIGYMSLTMIGILEMYVPSFMKGEVKMYQQFGPFFAAYVFGVISGTIASPCVSPGLALLLSIVATLGNKFLGFCLLFAFGIGLSTPLMIIATFSNSLHLLPKSGMWMVEIKKLLGFFMLGTCFYYLGNILPIAIVYWLFTLFTLFIGLFYFTGIYQYQNESYKTFYNIIAICMVSLSMFMGTKSYEKTFYQTTKKSIAAVSWSKNYATALEHAKEHNKLLLIDFWAQHCTMCKAIDKKVFENQNFAKQLEESVDFVKIDATQSDNPDYVYTKELYKVYAQPTIIVVDPKTETIVKRWTSEPYSMNIQDFITTILQIKNQLQSL